MDDEKVVIFAYAALKVIREENGREIIVW